MIVPNWFYQAVLGDARILSIDPDYFDLTGGLDRWLYRLVRKHGGRQRAGWRFEFRHLHLKSGSLSPFKRFAFDLREIIRRQPLPGYRLALEIEPQGRRLLAFEPCGQAVNGLVLSGSQADETEVENGPDDRLFHGDGEMAREIGAAWTRTGEKAGEYLSVLIDDPMLAQPIRANLFRNGEASVWALQWSRPPKRNGKD